MVSKTGKLESLMKVTINLELTPKEARAAMGLPDVEPLQEKLMAEIYDRMSESVKDMSDPEKLLKMYMPLGNQSMEQFQKMMSMFTPGAGTSKD